MVTSRTEGSVANYTCNDNYELIGNESRTCMDDGMWSGQEPTCIRMYEECICDVYTFTTKIRRTYVAIRILHHICIKKQHTKK